MTRASIIIVSSLAAAAAVLAGDPSRAHACGGSSGGGSSGGGSSGGGGGGSYSSGDSSSYSAPVCTDASDVVGHRTCTRYGTWGNRMKPYSMELGMVTSMIDISGVSVGGSIDHSDGTHYTYKVVGDDLGDRATAVGVVMRMLSHHGWFYAGYEAQIAGVASDPIDRMDMPNGATLSPHAVTAFTNGVVLGARTFAGNLSVGGEVMAGFRALTVRADSQHDVCTTSDTQSDLTAVLEARARADYWLSPWVSAGAWLGRDVRGGDTSGGLSLAVHFQSYDGHR